MQPILSSTDNGLQLTFELVPDWVTVGYGGPDPKGPFQAVVAVGYDRRQLPLVKLISKAMRDQEAVPVISIFDDTVQLLFSTSPMPPGFMSLVQQTSPIASVFEELDKLNITSMADVFPEDDGYKTFMGIYERNRAISLVLMETALVGPGGGGGVPFEIFTVNDLKTEFQSSII